MDVVRKSLSERLSLNKVRSVFKKRRRGPEEQEEESEGKRMKREVFKRPSLAQDSHTFGYRKTADCTLSSNPFLRKSHSGLKFFPAPNQPQTSNPSSSIFRFSNKCAEADPPPRLPNPLLTADKPANPPKERKSEYVPQIYPFKIIKKWETATGKVWNGLSMDERRSANKEMSLMK